MFKRVFKLILVGTLIFGITVPSNAAVSVSDGSAFVTKAEFSADLNNLSNRMAQLENSLDAKIDSLVSSYLTRNGIWNGAKQELKTSIIRDMWTGSNPFSGVTPNWQSKPTTSNLTAGVWYDVRNGNFDFIEKCSKSGLFTININVYLPIEDTRYNSTDTRVNSCFLSKNRWTNSDVDSDILSSDGSLSFYIDKGSSAPAEKKASIKVWDLVPTKVLDYRANCFRVNVSYQMIVFFVSKDDKIFLNYRLSYSPANGGAATSYSNRTLEITDGAGLCIQFSGSSIY